MPPARPLLPRAALSLAVLVAVACTPEAPPPSVASVPAAPVAQAPVEATPAPLPTLTIQEQSGVRVGVPAEWKLLVKPDIRNVTMSHGLATTLTLYWYDYRPAVTGEAMLEILLKTVRQQLPIGELQELDRRPMITGHEGERWMPVRGELVHAEVQVGALGMSYTMHLGFATLIDEPNRRIVAAILLAPPDDWERIGALELAESVSKSLALTDDPGAPTPGWWWGTEPPQALAALTTASEAAVQ